MDQTEINFTRSDQNGIVLIEVNDKRLDSRLATRYKQEFLVMKNDGIKSVIVDLSNVTFIDSSGLGALLFGRRIFNESNGDLRILGAREKVLNMFRIAKLDRVFEFYDDQSSAMNSFSD